MAKEKMYEVTLYAKWHDSAWAQNHRQFWPLSLDELLKSPLDIPSEDAKVLARRFSVDIKEVAEDKPYLVMYDSDDVEGETIIIRAEKKEVEKALRKIAELLKSEDEDPASSNDVTDVIKDVGLELAIEEYCERSSPERYTVIYGWCQVSLAEE